MPTEMYDDESTGNSVAKPRSEKNPNSVSELTDNYFSFIEQSDADSSYWSDSQVKPYNPDQLVQKANDYSIYEDMTKDDQVSISLQVKKDLVIGSGSEIVANSDDDQAQDIKKFLEEALFKDPEIVLDDSLEEILSAYEFGFSVSEKVFKKRSDGKITLKFIKTRHPVTWLIHTDEKGNITKYEQRASKSTIFIDPNALMHYTTNAQFGNPYGTSDLKAAYSAYFVKRQVVNYYAIFLEKSASPIPVAKYNKDAPQAAVDAIFNAMKSFQQKTALAVPKDIEVEFLKSENNGDAYRHAIDMFNTFIGRSLFIPDLLGFQGSETSGGSYSLGKEQMDVLYKHINKRRHELEKLINKHIVKPLVYVNFGEVEQCPEWKLKPIRESEMVELAKLWLDAAKSSVVVPTHEQINYFNTLCKFPEVTEDELEVIQLEDGSNQPPNGTDGSQTKEDSEYQSGQKELEEPSKEDLPQTSDKSKKEEYKSKPEQLEYGKKVDFKKIETSMDAYINSMKDQMAPLVKKSINDLKQQLKRKKIIETQNLDKVDTLKLKYQTQMANVFNDLFKQEYKEAQEIAKTELEGSNQITVKKFATPLPDDEFLELLMSETWQAIGDWEYQVKRKTRVELAAAIKDGKPLSDVLNVLDDIGQDLTEVQMDRYARTKFTEVMNRGRHEYFEQTGIIEAYQYSAILDDRTSDICEGLDGKIFAKGNEPIPPMHFNCRSMLVPITKYEEWKEDTKVGSKDIDKFIDDNIGEGFARQ